MSPLKRLYPACSKQRLLNKDLIRAESLLSTPKSSKRKKLGWFGAKLWNSICDGLRQLLKTAFKTHISDMLLSLLEAEDDYDQVSIPLQKIANYKV